MHQHTLRNNCFSCSSTYCTYCIITVKVLALGNICWMTQLTQLVKELLSFDFWISRHFVTIFRNIRTFEDTISPKAIEVFRKFFSHLFLSRHVLSKLFIFLPCLEISILLSILWRHFPTKNRENRKTNNIGFFGIQSSTILQSLSSNE